MNIINKKLYKNIYDDMKINSKVSQKELAKKYDVCKRTIRRYCKILKDNGYINYIIDSKNSRWNILK